MTRDIASRYGVTCLPVNCLTLDDNAVGMILKAILYEFPLCELDLFIPPWVEALADDHPIKSGLYQAIRENTGSLHCRARSAPSAAAKASAARASRPFSSARASPRRNCSSRAHCSTGR